MNYHLAQDPMRLLIIEDDPLLRNNLRLLLDGESGIDVVGVCASAEEAEVKLPDLNPDILLCDLGLPGKSGVELIAIAKSKLPDLDIMAYTIFEDRQSVFSAIKAGASGYILKSSTPRELIEALYTLRNGGSPMTPKIARAVIREFQGESVVVEELLLTTREKEVLMHIEAGLSYKQIATKLNISRHTVHSHIKNTYDKLQARDKQEAIIKARRKGIL